MKTYCIYAALKTEVTSNSVKSVPPVIFQTIPVALSMPTSSRGDWIAFIAASLALDFPESPGA